MNITCLTVTDNFSKNFKWMLYLFGVIFLDLHLLTLQLEFNPSFRRAIPVYDLAILAFTYYLISSNKKKYLFIPMGLILAPLGVLAVLLREQIAGFLLSEYYFFGFLLKTLLFLAFINALLSRDKALTRQDHRFIFIFFLLLLILPNAFYVLTDFTPASWDPARHSKNAFHIFNLLFEEKKGLLYGYMHYDLYPSISYLVCIPFILLFGKSNDSLIFSILLFWLPLSFYYAKKVAHEVFKVREEHAVLISFIYHSNILFLSLYKQFLLDFQPIALLPVYYYFIWRSSFFNNRKYSIIAGLIIGIGVLSKQSFLLYIAPLALVLGCKVIWNSWLNLKNQKDYYIRKWTNLFLHLIIALALIIPWFGGWLFMYTYEMGQVPAVAKMEGDPDPHTLASVLWYFPKFLYTYTWPFLLLLLTGWFFLLKKEKLYIHKYIAAFSILLIFVALTLNYNKDLRYIGGLFFFSGFGYYGLAYMSEKLRTYVLISGALLSIVYSIQMVSWSKIRIPGIDLSNYVLPEAPQPPSSNNEAEALAAFEKLFLQQHGQENNVLKYQSLQQDIYFNSYSLAAERNMLVSSLPVEYDSIAHQNLSMSTELFRSNYNLIYGPKQDSSLKFLFGKDSLYPSYYLLGFYKSGNKGLIRRLGFEGDVFADIRLIIKSFAGDSLLQVEEGWIISERCAFQIPSTADHLEVAINMHHHMGRWQLIYLNKFTPYYKNNYLNGSFVPYSKETNENKNWIIPLK